MLFLNMKGEKLNGMSDEEVRAIIRDMKYHMSLLSNGDKACGKLIDYMKNLLK